MAFVDGKKTERVLMRVTEEMKREVEALASSEVRRINDQYRVLIAIGLEHVRAARTARERTLAGELSSTLGISGQLNLPGTVGPVQVKKRRTA